MTTRQPNRRNLSVDLPTADMVDELRAELAAITGTRVTIGDTVRRAVQCLHDAHQGRRWLSGPEAAVTMQRRHEEVTVNTIAQVLTRFAPDVQLNGISFDRERGVAWLHVAGGDSVSMVLESVNDVASRN